MRDHGNDAFIAGIDEVGRGAWAGPVVAGAVILPFGARISGLNDSKLVSPAKRLVLDVEIRRRALGFRYRLGIMCRNRRTRLELGGASKRIAGVGRAGPSLRRHHFGWQTQLSGRRHEVAGHYQSRLARHTGGGRGSIIAKVARDQYMERLHLEVPHYGFDLHKGYGTASHRQALAEAGALATIIAAAMHRSKS